jgi:hypothetical protein
VGPVEPVFAALPSAPVIPVGPVVPVGPTPIEYTSNMDSPNQLFATSFIFERFVNGAPTMDKVEIFLFVNDL